MTSLRIHLLQRAGKTGPLIDFAGAFDRVYKDECMYTFATPEHADGLFTNLKVRRSCWLILTRFCHRGFSRKR